MSIQLMMNSETPTPGSKSQANNPLTGRATMARALQIVASDGRRAISLSRNDWNQAEEELNREGDQSIDSTKNE